MATPKRPLSPFMLGSYYRFQLTSLSSLMHRATGVALAVGSLLLAAWLGAAAAGPEAFATMSMLLGSLPGKAALFVFSACLVYHLLNGIRHLAWDLGYGFAIPTVYATGWGTLIGTGVLTVLAWLACFIVG